MKKPNEFWHEASVFLGSDQLVKTMHELLAAAVFDLTTNEIIGLTPLAVRRFGYESESELVGRSLHELIPARFRKAHLNHVQDFRSAPQTIQMSNRRLPALRKDGSEFELTIWLIPSADVQTVLAVFFE